MIVELTIENFKSIREPTTISFAAGSSTNLLGNLRQNHNGERIVKSMALYGPNASGKTTVLDALHALGLFVLFSSKDQSPTAKIPGFEAFLLDRQASKLPSRISLTLELDRAGYAIEVVATSRQIIRETLSFQKVTKVPRRKAAFKYLIQRQWDPKLKKFDVELDESMGPTLTLSAAKEQTTDNRLILGKLASLNSDVAKRLIEWVEGELEFYAMHRNPFSEDKVLSETARLLKENSDFEAMVARFMKDADTGIQSLRIDEEKVPERVLSEDSGPLPPKISIRPALSFQHSTQDGSEVFFRRYKESSGTLRFVALLVAILQPSDRSRLVCVDELSASMHPDLVKRLIQIVHSSKYNPSGNQLLFTTHDTHLIDPTELLRRDQVIICDKDRFGRTTAKRLDDFQDAARSDANLQKQYLQGRFGGLPQFGPTLEDVPVDDEPMEAQK